MINEIVLRRRNKITMSDSDVAICKDHQATFYPETDKYAVAMMKNIESLGFTVDSEVFNVLRWMSKGEITMFYKELIPCLKKMRGADVEYNPMYPNFPKQVAEMDQLELFINAIIHYWSFGTLMPGYEKEERFPLFDNPKLTVLSIGSMDDYWEIFSNLLSSKTSISDADREDIATIISENDNFYDYLPDEIPFKENVAFLCKTILEQNNSVNADAIQKYFKTATDVLRLVTSMSNGDISLAKNTKFRKLKRSERRLVMDLLAGCGNIKEDMYRYKDRWIRIGEIVHPSEFNNVKYRNVKQAFHAIRNERKPLYFGGKVQEYIQNGNTKEAAKLLEKRPGEFARQLDKLLRDSDRPNYVINSFSNVANEVSVPLLFNLRQHFLDRNDEKVRVVMPKGMTAKAYTIPVQEKEIDPQICKAVAKICENAIIEQLKEKDYLGKVYVDEEFKSYVAPFSQRSASTANKTLVRGSRVKIDDATNYVRGFIWWTNEKDGHRTDIDLSVSIFDVNWNHKTHVSYTWLRDREYNIYHSGDIVNGGDFNGKGVAEFIDIDINTALAHGARYAVFTVHGYTMQPFSKVDHLRFGWMNRKDVESGEIFEPSTVEMSMDVNAESRLAIPVIFDLATREFIWCDIVLAGSLMRHCGGNNIESNLSGTVASCYAISNIRKPSLYDLICFNAYARGTLTDKREAADIIFSNDTTKPIQTDINEEGELVEVESDVQIYTVYDLDYYMGQLY